jgi:hypothetical protein
LSKYILGQLVCHTLLPGKVLTVMRVEERGDPTVRAALVSTYEIFADGTTYTDVAESDLSLANPVTPLIVVEAEPAKPLPKRNHSTLAHWKPSDGPGWVYDLHTGQDLGPASYELRERFDAGGGQPIDVSNWQGCDRKIVIRPRKEGN